MMDKLQIAEILSEEEGDNDVDNDDSTDDNNNE